MLTAFNISGNLLWKVEQKTMTAFACAKVSVKGKRHWYKAAEQIAFVALSDDSAWIIRTNGDLFLQTGNFTSVLFSNAHKLSLNWRMYLQVMFSIFLIL